MVSRSSIMPASSCSQVRNSAEVQVRVQQAGNAGSGEAGECPPPLGSIFVNQRGVIAGYYLPSLVGGLEHVLFSPIVGMMIQSDELRFFRGVGIPPTSSLLDALWLRTPLEMDRFWIFFVALLTNLGPRGYCMVRNNGYWFNAWKIGKGSIANSYDTIYTWWLLLISNMISTMISSMVFTKVPAFLQPNTINSDLPASHGLSWDEWPQIVFGFTLW